MQKVESNLSPMLPTKAATAEENGEVNMEDLFIDVSLPQVIEEYVTEKMLVMTFIDGFKVRSDGGEVDIRSRRETETETYIIYIYVERDKDSEIKTQIDRETHTDTDTVREREKEKKKEKEKEKEREKESGKDREGE